MEIHHLKSLVHRTMLSRIEKASKRVFSDKESKLVSHVLDDGDDLFITASFQPGEENSSVTGNTSVMESFQMAAIPSDSKCDGRERSESSFISISTTTAETRDDFDEADPTIPKKSLPGRMTRTIPQISKITEDLPWVFPGTDHVSRYANDTLDAGDDLHISESFEPSEDNSSVIGNTSVVLHESDEAPESVQETLESSATPIYPSKAKGALLGKFSMRGKISRILPSKQYVSKLSKLAEDVPWTLPAQDQKSKSVSYALEDDDEIFPSDQLDTISSVVGNSSVMDSKGPSFSDSTEPNKLFAEKSPIVSDTKSSSDSEHWKAASIFGKQAITGKLNRAFPGKVIRSSQKLLPWRLKSLVSSNYRSGMSMEYQEMQEDATEVSENSFDPLLRHYNLHRDPSGETRIAPELYELVGRRAVPQHDDRGIQFSLSSDSESARGRSLTWDNSSCSGMSDITEPTLFSKSGSFRRSRSMYIEPPESSLLGSSDDLSREEAQESGTPSHNVTEKIVEGQAPVKQEQNIALLPDINESKPFNAMTSEDIFAPDIVNGFLNRIRQSEKLDELWDARPTLSRDDRRAASRDVIEDFNRQRVFSDSDVVFEAQRQRLVENEQAFLHTPRNFNDIFGGSFGDDQLDDPDMVDLFVDSDEYSQEMVSDYPSKIESTPTRSLLFPNDEYSQKLTRSRFFSDSECTIDVHHTRSQQSIDPIRDGLKLNSSHHRPRFSSDSVILSNTTIASLEIAGQEGALFSNTAGNTVGCWSRRYSDSRGSAPKSQQGGPEKNVKLSHSDN